MIGWDFVEYLSSVESTTSMTCQKSLSSTDNEWLSPVQRHLSLIEHAMQLVLLRIIGMFHSEDKQEFGMLHCCKDCMKGVLN